MAREKHYNKQERHSLSTFLSMHC